jgi:hypothetical protein
MQLYVITQTNGDVAALAILSGSSEADGAVIAKHISGGAKAALSTLDDKILEWETTKEHLGFTGMMEATPETLAAYQAWVNANPRPTRISVVLDYMLYDMAALVGKLSLVNHYAYKYDATTTVPNDMVITAWTEIHI